MTPIWIVGVDGSDLSLAGLDTAAALAARSGTEILVVHVRHVPTACYENPSAVGIATTVLPELENAANTGAHSTLSSRDINWRFDVRQGDPADELIAAAQESRAELIAIRGHSHSALGHLLLGSVALRLLQRATTSVLILH